MSELTLTLLRLGLLALLWIFIFSVVAVLRTDLYGTAVSRRGQRKAAKRQAKEQRKAARAPQPAAVGAGGAAGAAGVAAGAAGAPGAPVPVSAPADGAPAPRWGRGRGKGAPTTLVVTEGPLTGTTLPLRSGGLLIGRNPECALVLDDDYASGRHCRIYPDPTNRGGWVVEDLGSTNGTFIGRDKLTSARPVEIGTTLRIGKTVLELRG
ncbi:FHA domain-containing protein FhaB/FipA [Humibacillus xanthopallidus]|uniref:FHA domain-containing protein n=1 Tax=Humibacillus xanthopallidus TaxID=412689 RepID=A0A543H9T8_9MICO|nr:FHA domain-containing protein [Humibacillus xanthopallidus]TQM55078.1 FHA domain-containing protein [Humibacillus xanthopallidus]